MDRPRYSQIVIYREKFREDHLIKQQFNHGDVFQATGKVYADFVEFLKIHTGLVLLTVIGSAFAPASFWLMEMLMPNQPVSAAVTVLIIAVQIFLVTPLYLLVFRFAGLGNRPPLPFPATLVRKHGSSSSGCWVS